MRTPFSASRLSVFGLIVLLAVAPSRADVRLSALFSDHMVLQADKPVNVWGWADPQEEVTVAIAGQSKSARAGGDGRWMVKLDPLKAGEAGRLTASGKNSLTVNDVLVGQVWVCSGQSNMGMTVNRAMNFDQERAAAEYPEIRQFKTDSNAAKTAQADCTGSWVVCSPETVGGFTATGYFFGRELHTVLDTPVGLINSSVGGTPIESWIDAATQRADPQLKGFFETQDAAQKEVDSEKLAAAYEKQLENWKKRAAAAKKAGESTPRKPRDPNETAKKKGDVGGLFNGMIAPLIPYTIAGAIWYQGEANSRPEKAPYYQEHISLLVRDWRKRWGQGDFPVAWVQLPNFTREGPYWPLVREGMLKALAVPNTGMAITIDVGDPKNIHPPNKQAVGKRLAQWALATIYGKSIVSSGPLPAGSEVRDDKIVVSFKYADGLTSRSGEVTGFEIAGADRKWYPAQARIKDDTVIVSSPEVKQPVAVRYAWADNPPACLYNGAGLPASPFRTDDWPIE